MQENAPTAVPAGEPVLTRHHLSAYRLKDELQWGVGDIAPLPAYADEESHRSLIAAVLDAIEDVSDDEEAYSSCTDGRLPIRLMDDESVPVREQLVGADMVSAFYVAESLGERFYVHPDAPVAERVAEVASFLQEQGLSASSHVGCGAGIGFVAITENVGRFSQEPAYIARLQAVLPEGVFDASLHDRLVAASQERLKAHLYTWLSIDTFLATVEKTSGQRAIAELRDDGRGVHGHVEEAIVRVRVPGKAINQAKLAAATNGRQVFGVNDGRMERLARIFARGNDEDYRLAMIALEDFASAGHGTLAKNLPTYIVTPAA